MGSKLAFAAFEADCTKDPDCPLTPDASTVWDNIVAAASASPLPVTGHDGETLDGSAAVTGMYSGLYSPLTWPQLARAMAAAADGDGTGLYELAQMQSGEPQDGFAPTSSSNRAINCADFADRPTVAQVLAAARRNATINPRTGPMLAGSAIACSGWTPSADPVGPVSIADGARILIVGTRNDPATPLIWSQQMHEAITGSTLLIYGGQGHTAYGSSTCVTGLVDEFLLSGTPPTRTDCPEEADAASSDRVRDVLADQLEAGLTGQGLTASVVRCITDGILESLSDEEVDLIAGGQLPDGYQAEAKRIATRCATAG